MTKDSELELANRWLSELPKDSYLYDLLSEAIPLWEDYIRSDGFYCQPLTGLNELKKQLRSELSELEDRQKKLEQTINTKELELERMRRILIDWHGKINELANDCRYLSDRLFKHGVDYEKNNKK